jgi:hypothetical protein
VVPAEDLWVVCECADDPVDEALEHGVEQPVAEVEEEGAGIAVLPLKSILSSNMRSRYLSWLARPSAQMAVRRCILNHNFFFWRNLVRGRGAPALH